MFDFKDYQQMKVMFSQYITRYAQAEKYYAKRASEMYDRCDPKNPDSKGTFDMMNHYRDISREFGTKRQRIEGLQKKVKKELEHCVATDRWLTALEAEGGAFHKDLEEGND